MSLTAFSFVILPLCLFWAGSPAMLLRLMLMASVFEAAAVCVVGGLGVQPGLPPALAFIAFVSLQVLLGVRYPGTRQALNMVLPFVLVTIWAVASSYVMPRFLSGKVMVWPQKQLPPFSQIPLEPSSSNMNQDCYLIIDCMFTVAAALFLTKSTLRLTTFFNTYLITGFVVAGVSVWEFANRVARIPYPEDILYSNPSWAVLATQTIGRVPRINGPFTEPSALAVYMFSIVCATGWIVLQGSATKMIRVLLIVGLLTMMMSTSTTGFAALGIVGALLFAMALLSGSFKMFVQALKLVLPLVVFFALAAAVAGVAVPNFGRNVSEVIDATMNKQDSSSYNDRTSADVDSFAVAVTTGGLGVGWGSNRSSSLIPGLAAGLGLPGLLGLAWFAVSLARGVRRSKRLQPSAEQKMIINGCCGGASGLVIAAALSAPTITSVTFYFLVALLIACIARVELDAQADAAAMFMEADVEAVA